MAYYAGTAGSDDFAGTPEADLMVGEAGDDVLRGRGGDDLLYGMGGSDELRGGAGNDYLNGEIGDDFLSGGLGDDVLWGEIGNDEIWGGEGDDVINDGGGDDWADGGDGNDRFYSSDGDDLLLGGAGNDSFELYRTGGFEAHYICLDGGDGNDRFNIWVRQSGLIEIAAGPGSDSVEIEDLTDRLTVFFDPDGTDSVTLSEMTADSYQDSTIVLYGFARGDKGAVIVWHDFLARALSGWDGSSNPFGSGFARIGFDGWNQLLEIDPDGGGDSWVKVLNLGPSTGVAFTAHNFDGFSPSGEPAAGRVLVGTSGADRLDGNNGSDTISGLDGDDRLYGRAGSDSIDAGAGNDHVEGGPGADRIDGGAGDDYLVGGHGDDIVRGGAGNDWLGDTAARGGGGGDALHGDDGDDQLIMYRYEPFFGEGVIDSLDGGNGDDILILQRYGPAPGATHFLSGGEGKDRISAGLAGAGTLIIDGGAGEDIVTLFDQRGGASAIVTLGAGADILTSGYGWDPFESSLRITDFEAGKPGDRLDFSASLGGVLTGDWTVVTLFQTGHFGLVPFAGGTLLLIDRDGGGDDFVTLATLDGVTPLALQNGNIGGSVLPFTSFTEGSDQIAGTAGTDFLSGLGGADFFRLQQGGDDAVAGGLGDDAFYFGAAYTASDHVDGGAGTDTLILQGHYAGGVVLGAFVTAIENISILAGSNTNFGEPGTGRYDYVLTTHDSNFAAGVQARINGSALLAGEDFTFDGSAETDARFVVYGGRGKDSLTGSRNADIFFFAEERFATGDTVNGGAGYDGMFLRGNYTIDFNAPGYTGLFTNIENLTLTSATDERYARGGGTEFDYNLVLSNAIVKPGETLTVSGALLMANETMIVDASAETDGFLSLFGGKSSDTLKGGALADLIHGNLGADQLTGNGGADVFRYQGVGESTASSLDHILDFEAGVDKVDLSRMDADTNSAGNQAFSWIGSNAFSGSAGQLRAYQNGASWFVEGDTNGDGVADLVIQLTVTGGPLGQGDFLP
jgi:Ca2+-binding RTX toxin-like protein